MSFDRMFSVFRISGSGMSAQRKALDAAANNIANIETTRTEKGGPYIPQRVRVQQQVGDPFDSHVKKAIDQIAMNRSNVKHYQKGQEINDRDPEYLGYGVQAETVDEQDNPVKMVYEPDHPDADAQGYVAKPNISLVKEMTSMMVASRLYEANISVMDAAKGMMKKALEI